MLRITKKNIGLTTVLVLLAAPGWAGYHYRAVTTTEGNNMDPTTMAVEAWVDGGNGKVVFTESTGDQANPFFSEGKYLLTDGAIVNLVDPVEETYAEFDFTKLLGGLGKIVDSGVMKMEVTNHKVEKLLEEDGGQIHGLNTTHYQYRTSYTLSVGAMGVNRSDDYVILSDFWTTDQLKGAGWEMWLHKVPKKTGVEAIDTLMEGELGKMTGFVLRSLQKTTSKGAKKGKRSMSTTSEINVTFLEEQRVSKETFVLDPAFEEIQLIPDLTQLGRMDEEEGKNEEDEEKGFLKRLRDRRKGDG